MQFSVFFIVSKKNRDNGNNVITTLYGFMKICLYCLYHKKSDSLVMGIF